ncbi:MAG: ATP-binding protein, partial [Lentisphaerae bacterium]|nr:ATP-binding protein [Lentisphaerota bacterium]
MYIARKFDKTLLAWKSRDNRLPLIVEGARQVGKSECIEHFAEGRYSSFVEINFVERPEFKGVVRDGYSTENIIRNISQIDTRFRFDPGSTLIFFDEIQEFPDIATSLKFFAQDGRFDVICSGSLLGLNVKRIRSLSVGYQDHEKMFSLDFEEFLKAKG